MIWGLLALVLLPLLVLLLVGGRESDAEADPAAHYRRQLRELEEDLKNRVLTVEAAASARLEIERRILRLADHQEGHARGVRTNLLLPFLLGTLLAAASFLLYYKLGNPSTQSKPGQVVSLLDEHVTPEGPTYREAIDKLQAHLAENPDDRQGWEVLAKSSRSVRAYSIAANAFGELVRLRPDNSDWRVQQFEAFMAMAGGQITPAAQMLLEDLIEMEPQHPAAHYYLGLVRQQAGDADAAKAIWLALADRSPADAPWMPTVNQRLSELGVAPPKLTKDEIDQVAAMSAGEQDAFVRSMIERLQARLESSPEDAEGWLMLARSQAALGEKDAAIATLTRALTLVSEDKRPMLAAFLDNLRESPNS